MLTVISFLVVLGVLVIAHEFGHFIVAKKVGIMVEEFAVGMGPRLWSFQRGETIYSIRILPLGGFCRMAGENPYEESLAGEEERRRVDPARTFYARPVWERVAVVAAGPLMNFLLAVVVFAVIFSVFGIPAGPTNEPVIGEVIPGQPAAEAGLMPGDRVLRINGEKIATWTQLAKVINAHPGQEVLMEVQRGEEVLRLKVTPQAEKPGGVGIIGIIPAATRTLKVGPLQGLALGFVHTGRLIVGMVVGLFQLLTGELRGPLTGPIGIARMTGQAARFGLDSLLNLTAFISLQLGLFNLLPLPALDGGRLTFLGVEAVRRRPVNPEKEGFIHFIGFAILMFLLLLVTFRDIMRLEGLGW